jgi:hypothetical protein
MSIAENIQKLKSIVPPYVSVIAVTKTRSEEEILQAYYKRKKIWQI